MRAIKGFDRNLRCRDFQFEVGGTYTVSGPIRACENGFHAIPEDQHPLNVFDYYPPAGSVFHFVEIGGEVVRDGDKVAGEILTVGEAIPDLADLAVKWVTARATEHGEHATGDQSVSTATGTCSASSATGDQSASTATGYRSASVSTGTQSASSATGTCSASVSTGFQSVSTATGFHSASSATGDHSVSTATGTCSASVSTGYGSASSATGYGSASSATGDQSASKCNGDAAGAVSFGYGGTVAADRDGCALFAVERDSDGDILSVACGIVGRDGLQPNVWYRAVGGKLVEAAK